MQRMVSEMSMTLVNGCRLAGLAFTFSLGVLLQLLVNPDAFSLYSMSHLQLLSNVSRLIGNTYVLLLHRGAYYGTTGGHY